jgi:arylsulfatase A-like enzyme
MTVQGRHGDTGLAIGRQSMQPVYDFIERSGDSPFFVWYAPMMPHEPHNPPERLLAKYRAEGRHEKVAKYWAMCEWFDETCGELMGYLDRKGLRENTLVVFVVDNGWIQETHPIKRTRGNFAPRSKLSPYDGGLRTPVMLRWPGHTRPGRYEDLVSTIDLAPTMLTACGVAPPKAMTGVNLLPRAAGKAPLKRKAVFGELYEHTALDINEPSLNLTHRWVREGEWKLIDPVEASSRPELYHVALDPLEERDLAGEHPEKIERLRRLLDQWWRVTSTVKRQASQPRSSD